MRLLCLFVVLNLLVACGSSDGTDDYNAPGENYRTETGLDVAYLRVGSPSPEPFPAGADAKVLARIVNNGDQDDALVSASSPASDEVQLVGEDGNPVSRITIPAGGLVDLTDTGPHVALLGLRELMREGDVLTITLTFEQAGAVTSQIHRRVDVDTEYEPTSAPSPSRS